MVDQIWLKVNKVELKEVEAKLLVRKGTWWKFRNDIDRVEKEYRQFLYLIAANPGETIVPWSEALDDLWHEHILDTKKYAADCDAVFGKFIHHNPHLDKGTSKHTTASKNTKTMYQKAFQKKADDKKRYGETYDAGTAGCGAYMPMVFDCHSASHDTGSHGHSDSGHCGDSGGGDSGGSSCGGGCGGGGD